MPLNERGHEVPDPKPMAVPIHFKRPPSLAEQIKKLVRNELSQQASNNGLESFEEGDDFAIGDDFDPLSPWELSADQEAESRPSTVIPEVPADKKPAAASQPAVQTPPVAPVVPVNPVAGGDALVK